MCFMFHVLNSNKTFFHQYADMSDGNVDPKVTCIYCIYNNLFFTFDNNIHTVFKL